MCMEPSFLLGESEVDYYGLKVKIEDVYIDPKIPALITGALSKMHHALPYKIADNRLYVAMKEPMDIQAVKALRFASRHYIVPVLALGERLDDFISYHYRLQESEEILTFLGNDQIRFLRHEQIKKFARDFFKYKNKKNLLTQQQSEAILRIIDLLIEQAVHLQASDIHIEPSEDDVQIRFRISGILRNIMKIPVKYYPVIVNRIKLLAKLNIAEKKKPQDGSIHINKANLQASLRVSVMASTIGEKIVIRVLSKNQFIRDERELGFSSANLQLKRSIMKNMHGIIIVAGPTGSGKTTTLYSLLQDVSDSKFNVVTIEDPVEYQMNGITQIHVEPKYDMTFSSILRSVLRQDPDVILLGEVRDSETAETAFTASMTGHLILTSIHTNDTVSTISRLVNLGIESQVIALSLRGVIAQRLINAICPYCKEPYIANDEDLNFLKLDEPITLFKASGCDFCQYTGYHGRLPVHEILEVNSEICRLIENNETSQILEKARENGLKTLYDGCREYVLAGLAPINELYRIGY